MQRLVTFLAPATLVLVAGVALAQPKPTAPPPPLTTPAAPTCFQLSPDGQMWSKTPERLCIASGFKNVEIKLQTGMPTPTDVAVFRFDLKTRVKCADCNKDVFALTNPENSVFNALAITFDGKRDLKTGAESGTVTVGATKFFYRRAK